MPGGTGNGRRRVAVVTGGGAGIGAAIAEELGRIGHVVVTMDPLVSLDGSVVLPAPEETTAGRIVAAGGAARSSSISVTDGPAVRELFEQLVAELGGLDAVINVAGITRPTTYATGTEEDWHAVLAVHLEGYLNVLRAALPIMGAAGHGSILGVTSGSGWRAADAGAYGCAKRAVAALTWELGAAVPAGVRVNALSPLAVTRMVTAALERHASAIGGRGAATGGLSLGSMPPPEHLGPLAAHLVGDDVPWCRGQVIFAAGAEVAVIDRPRLLEAVRLDDASSVARVLDAVVPGALVRAEREQASGGGGNPRFGSIFDASHERDPVPVTTATATGPTSCVVVSDRPELVAAAGTALAARGVAWHGIEADAETATFTGASRVLAAAAEAAGPVDAVVVALAGASGVGGADGGAAGRASAWAALIDEHAGLAGDIRRDAGWTQAVAVYAAQADRRVRLVTLTAATTAGGRTRAQAAAQLARAARGATGERVEALAVSVEVPGHEPLLGELAAHLACTEEAAGLAGGELVLGPGWFGLRSHPRPGGAVTFGGPGVPEWLDGVLRDMVGAPPAARDDVRRDAGVER